MKPRTCYIAGRFERRDEFLDVERQLAIDHITSVTRWLHMETDMRTNSDDKIQQFALMDLEDVRNADFLLAFAENLTDTMAEGNEDCIEFGIDNQMYVPAIWARGGRHVEFGIAIAEGLDIVVVGPRENIFHYLGDAAKMRHFPTFPDFIAWWRTQ